LSCTAGRAACSYPRLIKARPLLDHDVGSGEQSLRHGEANPLGIKGAGEVSAIPVGTLFAQTIENALGLGEKETELNEIPLSTNRLFELTTKLR
jgi:hypothetical protein